MRTLPIKTTTHRMNKPVEEYASLLQLWAAAHPRPMPWKGIRDPYKIWLSEVILQQTRVEQGLPYYERFVAAFPTVMDLARAPQDAVYKLWEGLGYYSRARNMHAAAQTVATVFHGQFPDTYQGIRSLKGVGDYTAAAIASFAYDLPYAVLDGNVYRVLARWMGLDTPIDSTEGKQVFSKLAQDVLDKAFPARHNQAMMDFGATWCTPKLPKCGDCPFQDICTAYQTKRVDVLPVKSKKLIKKERFFVYLVFKKNGNTFLQKREAKDIWQNLWTFPSIETTHLPIDVTSAHALLAEDYPVLQPVDILSISKPYKQTLTHRFIHAVFVEVSRDLEQFLPNTLHLTPWSSAGVGLPVPRIMEAFIQDSL